MLLNSSSNPVTLHILTSLFSVPSFCNLKRDNYISVYLIISYQLKPILANLCKKKMDFFFEGQTSIESKTEESGFGKARNKSHPGNLRSRN